MFPSKHFPPTIQAAIEPRQHIAPPGCRLLLLFHLWKTGVTPPQREGGQGGERSWTFTTWWCWEDWRVKVKQPGWWRKTDPAVERVPDDRQGDLRQHLSKDHRWRVPGQQLQVLNMSLQVLFSHSPNWLNQVHNRPLTSKLQRSHHLPHAKPALGELHVSHLQVGVGKCFYDTGLSTKLISYANIAFFIRPIASLLHQRYESEEEFVFKWMKKTIRF